MSGQTQRRFVILAHDYPFLHWDLMLEEDESLLTFRLLEEPTLGRTVAAEPLTGHRKAYLDYEGPVSGGRGTVTRWDHGTYRTLNHSPDALVLLLRGSRQPVRLTMQRNNEKWSCIMESTED